MKTCVLILCAALLALSGLIAMMWFAGNRRCGGEVIQSPRTNSVKRIGVCMTLALWWATSTMLIAILRGWL